MSALDCPSCGLTAYRLSRIVKWAEIYDFNVDSEETDGEEEFANISIGVEGDSDRQGVSGDNKDMFHCEDGHEWPVPNTVEVNG